MVSSYVTQSFADFREDIGVTCIPPRTDLVPVVAHFSNELPFNRICPVYLVARWAKRRGILFRIRPILNLRDDVVNLDSERLTKAASKMRLTFDL